MKEELPAKAQAVIDELQQAGKLNGITQMKLRHWESCSFWAGSKCDCDVLVETSQRQQFNEAEATMEIAAAIDRQSQVLRDLVATVAVLVDRERTVEFQRNVSGDITAARIKE